MATLDTDFTTTDAISDELLCQLIRVTDYPKDKHNYKAMRILFVNHRLSAAESYSKTTLYFFMHRASSAALSNKQYEGYLCSDYGLLYKLWRKP